MGRWRLGENQKRCTKCGKIKNKSKFYKSCSTNTRTVRLCCMSRRRTGNG